LNIILTELISSASNYDLFRGGFVSDPSFSCGAAIENLIIINGAKTISL
jgi:hypothetical protein